MTFIEAADYVLPFGVHKGKRIDTVAETDEGLTYLDWLLGDLADKKWHKGTALFNALHTYLTDPTIRRELEAARRDSA